MARNDITARVKVRDGTGPGLRAAKRNVSRFASDVRGVTTGVLGADLISSAGRAAMHRVEQFFRLGIEYTKAIEASQAQFRTLLGTDSAAAAQLRFVRDFAAETPFFIQQVADANRLLVQFTGSATDANKALSLVGNAAAGAGADVSNVALWWGRLLDGLRNNRPVGESLARLQELGIIGGSTRGAVEALVKANKGLQAEQIITADVTEKFDGAMQRLRETMGGAIDTAINATEELSATALEVSGVSAALTLGANAGTEWANAAVRNMERLNNVKFSPQVLAVLAYTASQGQASFFVRLFRMLGADTPGQGGGEDVSLPGPWNTGASPTPGQAWLDAGGRQLLEAARNPRQRRMQHHPMLRRPMFGSINLAQLLGRARAESWWAGSSGEMLPDLRDRESIINIEEITGEAKDLAHRDAQRALQVAQSVLSGIDRIVAGIQQGGKSGLFGAIGGILMSAAAFVPGPWQIPALIAGAGVNYGARYFGARSGETGASSPRSGGRGGATRAPVVNVHNTVMIDGDDMMTTVGRRAASSY